MKVLHQRYRNTTPHHTLDIPQQWQWLEASMTDYLMHQQLSHDEATELTPFLLHLLTHGNVEIMLILGPAPQLPASVNVSGENTFQNIILLLEHLQSAGMFSPVETVSTLMALLQTPEIVSLYNAIAKYYLDRSADLRVLPPGYYQYYFNWINHHGGHLLNELLASLPEGMRYIFFRTLIYQVLNRLQTPKCVLTESTSESVVPSCTGFTPTDPRVMRPVTRLGDVHHDG